MGQLDIILLEDRCGCLTKLSAFSGLHCFFFSSICSTCVQHAFSFLDEPSFRNKFEIPPEQVLSTAPSPSVSLKLLKINSRPSEKSHFLIFVFF